MPTGIYPRVSTEERFWGKVVKQEDGCWKWIGCLDDGYGRFWDGRLVRAHRLAFEWIKKAIPKEMTLDHLCRNRACVNPDHLEVTSVKVNILRGVGIAAINSKVTHCPKGHPYDEENTYLTPDGWRDCRKCRQEAKKRWQLNRIL